VRGCGYLIVMVLLAVWGTTTAAAQDSMRCGRYVVSAGDSQSRILDICGEPQSAWQDGFIEQVVRRRDGYRSDPQQSYPRQPGYETEYRRIVPVYKWEYNLGRGTLLKRLVFHGDTLVDISDGPRQ